MPEHKPLFFPFSPKGKKQSARTQTTSLPLSLRKGKNKVPEHKPLLHILSEGERTMRHSTNHFSPLSVRKGKNKASQHKTLHFPFSPKRKEQAARTQTTSLPFLSERERAKCQNTNHFSSISLRKGKNKVPEHKPLLSTFSPKEKEKSVTAQKTSLPFLSEKERTKCHSTNHFSPLSLKAVRTEFRSQDPLRPLKCTLRRVKAQKQTSAKQSRNRTRIHITV